MLTAQINVIYAQAAQGSLSEPGSAWNELQKSLGGGLAKAVIKTPDTRSSRPLLVGFKGHKLAPLAEKKVVKAHFDEVLSEWHYVFEELMNKRWDLNDNPYAKVWIMPGMLLIHEDPLGWVVDAHAEDIGNGAPLEDPTWTILMPAPTSNHAKIDAASAPSLPHAAILNAALTKAARKEGHDDICPLEWEPVGWAGGLVDIIAA